MNTRKVKKDAALLKATLLKYANKDEEVNNLYMALRHIIEEALSGKIREPVDRGNVPGGHCFLEGNLRKYRDLEEAYASFKIELSGGEPPALVKLRERNPWIK